MCVSCRNRTKVCVEIKVKQPNHGKDWFKYKYFWCCSYTCLERELKLIDLEMIERITGV